jgi:hypothetical protein
LGKLLKKVKSMKQKLMSLFFLLSCMSHHNYAMWGGARAASVPVGSQSSMAKAPEYKIDYAGPKVSSGNKSASSIDARIANILATDAPVKSSNTSVSQPIEQSAPGDSGMVARSIFEGPLRNTKFSSKSASSELQMDAKSANILVTDAPVKSSNTSVSQPIKRIINKPKEVAESSVNVEQNITKNQEIVRLDKLVENVAEGVTLDAVAKSASVEKIEQMSVEPVQQQRSARPNFLDAIKGRKVSSGSQSEVRQDVSQVKELQPLKFETLDAYQKALYEVEVRAEEQALKPINRQATEQFNKQWPEVLAKYTADRQSLNLSIVKERVDLLKDQTKNNINQDLMVQNKDAIELAKSKAIADFKARAVKPERVARISGGQSLKIPNQTESNVRTQGENQMKDFILTSMMNQSFTPEFESVWIQDYKLDYELKNRSQASGKNIQEAKKKYIDELRLEMYDKLTPENKATIKQAGQNAVEQWKLAQKQKQNTISVQQKQKGSNPLQSMTFAEQLQAQITKIADVARPGSPTSIADLNSRSVSPVSMT